MVSLIGAKPESNEEGANKGDAKHGLLVSGIAYVAVSPWQAATRREVNRLVSCQSGCHYQVTDFGGNRQSLSASSAFISLPAFTSLLGAFGRHIVHDLNARHISVHTRQQTESLDNA